MDYLVPKDLREHSPFINQDASRRTRAGMEQVGHHSRIVLVPFIEDFSLLGRTFGFGFGPGLTPARSGDFISVTVVPKLQHIVDAHAAVAVIVIIGLPERPK